jgi:hypothetical protein
VKTLHLVNSWLWRVAVGSVAHAVGIVVGAAVALAAGLTLPTIPSSTAGAASGAEMLLMLAGGAAIALGLAALAVGLEGSFWKRWAILGAFAFVVNGVGTAVEAEFFTTLGGMWFAIVANLPASLLCAMAVARLFPAPAPARSAGATGTYVEHFSALRLSARLLLGLLAFPFFYFLFGMMIAPIVVPHYERLDFLLVPPLSTLLPVLFFRSALFLAVSLPIVVYWHYSRGKLALAVGAGHFTAVGLSGLIQVTFFPAVIRWTHGVEILADSVFYGLALAWLLFAPPVSEGTRGREELPAPARPLQSS